MDKEVWKPINNYEMYFISNTSRVRKGDVFIKGSIDNTGYVRVSLIKDGKNKKFLLHRLVAQTFIPNPENKPQVNHKDGNKLNNNESNLEWVTGKENILHAKENDLFRRNRPDKDKKLEWGRQFKKYCKNNKLSQKQVAEKLHIRLSNITAYWTGKRIPRANTLKEIHNTLGFKSEVIIKKSRDSKVEERVSEMKKQNKPIWAIKFRKFCFNNDLKATDVAKILNLQTTSIYKYWNGSITVPDENKKILEKEIGLDIYEIFYNDNL